MTEMSKEQLLEELAVYQRSLDRERKARHIAEEELESYSRKIYQTEELLVEQSKQVQSKQVHLNFLTTVAEDNWLSDSVEELIDRYLTRSCHFLTSTTAAYFQIEQNLRISRLQVASAPNLSKSSESLTLKDLKAILAELDLAKLKQDFIAKNKGCTFDLKEYGASRSTWVFLLPIFHSKGAEMNKMSCMAFFYELADNIDLLKFETMEASHSTFSVAIERKKAEQALKQRYEELEVTNRELQNMQQQLIESEKLASLGQLSAGVAHEINNPVGFVISNMVSMEEYLVDIKYALEPLLNTKLTDSEKVQQFSAKSKEVDLPFLLRDGETILNSSSNGLARVKDIVADLNSFARMDSDELTEVSINDPIKSALNILNNELKYSHEVSLDLADNAVILGNEGQLQQVFINFFMNAKHAMADGGKLCIKSQQKAQRIIVTIKDEGCGISKEDLKEIFTPFFTTKPQGQGTGLGLSISYSILKRHHAKIDVRSAVGKGTVFALSFIGAM